MTFTTTALLDGGVLVEGTDSKGNDGTTILKSERWTAVLHMRAHEVAQDQFDAAVKEFFAPLTDAADAAKALLSNTTSNGKDWGHVTLGEDVEGTQSQIVELDEDGILLRMLAEGAHDQLRWVNDRLVAVAS